MKQTLFFILLLAFTLTGCYHARIETGLTPSSQVHDVPWAMGWVYGLVPPATVEAADECPNGVAIVETELSFLNQLVSALTFGIFTPMHIRVTCAAGGGMTSNGEADEIVISSGYSPETVVSSFEAAADEAVETGNQVYVRFE